MINVDFNNEKIFFSGQEIGSFYLTDRGKFLVLNEIRINPEYQGKGFAHEAMEQIINHSDKLGKILALTPSSDFGSNKNKLIDWYKSLGFKMNKGRNKDYETMELMFREPQNGVNEMIRREIWSMDEEISTSFNMEEFDKLPSFAARKRYADEHLQKIGAGSARIVYRTPDSKVLKLAKNPKGIAQNEFECSLMNDYYIADYITKIFNCHPNNLWILVEEAKKLSPKRFLELTSVKIDDLGTFLRNTYSKNNPNKRMGTWRLDNEEEMWENQFATGINDMVQNYGIAAGDLGKISSYGEVMRDGQPNVVITDYGLSDEIYSSHYARVGESLGSYFDEEPINEVEFQMQDFLDNAAEDGHIKDGGYASAASIPQSVSEGVESIDNYRDISISDLKKSTDFIENFNDSMKSNGEMISKLYKNYLIGSQNIESALKVSRDDINFFNKLINIQKYLKKFGLLKEDLVYWGVDDASPDSNEYELGAESINEVGDVTGLSKENADKVAEYVSEKFYMNPAKYMGEGTFGYAYDTGNAVIKVTTDKSEAVDSLEIKGQKNEHIADIFNVFHTNIKKASGDESVYVITLEKLDTPNGIKDVHNSLDKILEDNFEGQGISSIVVDEYINNRDAWNKEIGEDVMFILKDHPREKEHLEGLLAIADEVKSKGIDSMDFISPYNLGYKKNGNLGFFDAGFGDYFKKPKEKFQKLNIGEDGSSLYTNAQGTVDSDDIAWDLQEMVLDSLGDVISERIMSWMPKSKSVTVKKKCQLGGNGDGTSTACNQGDIDNIELKDIDDDNKHRRKANTTNVAEEEKYYDKNIEKLVTESILNEEKVKYGALMLYLDVPKWKDILSKIDEEDLYDDGSGTFGKEDEAHITVLYGFHSKVKGDDFNEYINQFKGINGKLKGVSLFENEKFDVIKFDVKPTKELLELRKNVETLPNTLTYKEYNPHMTVAYVKKGMGKKYLKIIDDEIEIKSKKLVFSDKNRNHTNFKLNENINLIEMIQESFKNNLEDVDETYRTMKAEIFSAMNISVDEYAEKIAKKLNFNEFKRLGDGTQGVAYDVGNNMVMKLTSDRTEAGEANKLIGKNNKHIGNFHKIYKIFIDQEYAYVIIREKLDVNTNSYMDLEKLADDITDKKYDLKINSILSKSRTDIKDSIYKLESLLKLPLFPENKKAIEQFLGVLVDLKNNNIKSYDFGEENFGFKPNGDLAYYDIGYSYDKFNSIDVEDIKVENQIKESMIEEADIMSLQELPFKDTVQKMGGKIYSVGGAVRDEFLGKESKDLDILITGIPMDKLEQVLSQFGKVDAVGKSFGVLKFKPQGATEDIDVAIPRTETATGEGGHKGFDVKSDHNLSIEDDLKRRDFTINAIAKDMEGNLIDPFGGQKDLANKLIRVVNPEAFSDDPLRMIRAIQFAARFGMMIDDKTKQMISQNAGRIKEIAGERILEELRKVVSKGGDPLYAADLLRETGLYENIFGAKSPVGSEGHWDSEGWNNIKTLGEFAFMLLLPIGNATEIFKNRLKGDIPTMKEITALDKAWKFPADTSAKARSLAHNMFMHSPESINSNIIPANVKKAAAELNSGRYPKSLKELALNGNDLMSMGLNGKEIGDTLKSLLINVYGDKIKNNKEDLLNSLKNRVS